MIRTFHDQATEDVWKCLDTKKARSIPRELHERARELIDSLNAAESLQDLRSVPGHHLESLSGNMQGCHSLRINRMYRIVFKFADGNASDVCVVDYHKG